MSRRPRPYAPGVAFHVTARLQGREPWFIGHERRVVELIRAVTARSDLMVVAYVVMPNHLHLVVIQGARPLAAYMQPLLTRIALFLRRTLAREGHIFERRFRASMCLDAEYFRNSIAYVHLNPVRASLVTDVSAYPWSSHRLYCDAHADVAAAAAIKTEAALRVFASDTMHSMNGCRRTYVDFVTWRLATDRYRAADGIGVGIPPDKPHCRVGDDYWQTEHTAPRIEAATRPQTHLIHVDLRDLALRVLSRAAPDMSLDLLRSGDRTRLITHVRRELIKDALTVGHRPATIASFLQISRSAVSHVSRGRQQAAEAPTAIVETPCVVPPLVIK